MLSATAIAAMRAVADGTMQSYATIKRKHSVDDGYGVKADVFSAIATNVPCTPQDIVRVPYMDTAQSDRTSISNWILVFPQGTDVDEQDKVEIVNSVGVIDTFEINGVYNNSAYEATIKMYAFKLT